MKGCVCVCMRTLHSTGGLGSFDCSCLLLLLIRREGERKKRAAQNEGTYAHTHTTAKETTGLFE